MSVCLYPRRMGRRTMKKSSRAFWMLVSFRISSRRWRVFLRTPLSGFSTRTTCASGRLFCRRSRVRSRLAPAELFRFAGSGDQAAREPECAGQGFYEIRYVNHLQLHHGNGKRPAGRSVSQFAALAAGKGARLMLLTKQQKYLLAVLDEARLRRAAAARRTASKDVCLFFA